MYFVIGLERKATGLVTSAMLTYALVKGGRSMKEDRRYRTRRGECSATNTKAV